MPNNVLDSIQKKKIFDALKTVEVSKLRDALVNAALNNEDFPLDCEDFTLTCKAYSMTKNIQVKKNHTHTIHSYIDEEILLAFQNLLNEPFEESKWRSNFLLSLAEDLKIQVNSSTLVELAIKEGKVYWQITKDGEVIYDRSMRKGPLKAFDFKNAHIISMTWEQFRLFKNSGKRGGSIAITLKCFINEFPGNEQNAAEVWGELITKRILDSNFRLSSTWHFTSSGNLTLDNKSIPYPEICTAFNNILTNEDNADKIACIPNTTLYREARSIKKWCTSGLIQGVDPNKEHSKVRLWDVGTKGHLDNHGKNPDGLDHDHNPSSSYLKDYIKKFSDADQTPENVQWLIKAREESGKNWSSIAIPKKLHDMGLSHGEGKKAQAKKIEAPFFDEVREYLDLIEKVSEKKPLEEKKVAEGNGLTFDKNDPIKALGAFRYMYRCQVKGSHGKVPELFFHHSADKTKIDTLFQERLERFIQKR